MTMQALDMPLAPEHIEAQTQAQSSRLIERTDDGELRISSLTIAHGVSYDHSRVIRLVRDNLTDLEEFGRVRFENQPFQTAGGTQRREVAALTEPQASLLITYMRNNAQVRKFKIALVKGFHEMTRQLRDGAPNNPVQLTRKQALQMALESEERAERAEAQILADAPKIEYMETFVANADAMSFRTVASTLRINESKLRDLLIACEWIYREDTERYSNSEEKVVPQYRYAEYSTKKQYFLRQQEHKVPRFRGEVMHTLKITAPGGNAISRLLQKAVAVHGDLETAISVLETKRQERIAERRAKESTQDGLF